MTPKTQQELSFSISRTSLAKELDFVASVAEAKTTMPILACVKATLATDGLYLTATSLDSTAQSVVPLFSPLEGDPFCVDLKRFRAIVKALKGEEVKLNVGSKLTITSGKSKFNLDLMPADKFPDVEDVEGESFTLSAESLQTGIALTRKTLGTDERTALDSLRLKITDDAIQLIGADGRGMACAEISANVGKSGIVDIGRHFVGSVDSLLSLASENVELIIGEKAVKLVCDGRAVSARRTAKQFPNMDAILKAPEEKACVLVKDDFIEALDRLMIVSQKDSINQSIRLVSLELNAEGLHLQASDVLAGSGSESLDVVGDPFSGTFNGAQVLLGISGIDTASVDMNFVKTNGTLAAYRFRSSWPLKNGATVNYSFTSGAMK